MPTAVKERPILMHARSVNGVLAGRKTQTRRIIKLASEIAADYSEFRMRPSKEFPGQWDAQGLLKDGCGDWSHCAEDFVTKCPFGQPGGRLWVRERWCERTDQNTLQNIEGKYWYEATDDPVMLVDGDGFQKFTKRGVERSAYRSALFMPRVASRLTLEVVSVQVERVQEIRELDAWAEGVTVGDKFIDDLGPLPIAAFKALWDDTNGKDAWERNDWVWVVEFKVVAHDRT